jgi:hypothetical protein
MTAGEIYQPTNNERRQVCMMIDQLANDEDLCHRLAKSRGWKKETIKQLALEGYLGWYDSKLAFIYDTGVKLRWRQDGERIIRWAFGKPWLWRGAYLNWGQRVYVCEGETDAITLIDAGIEREKTLVVALPSASTFNPEWAQLFSAKDLVLVFDGDEAGKTATARVTGFLRPVARSLSHLDGRDYVMPANPAFKDVSDVQARVGTERLAQTIHSHLVADREVSSERVEPNGSTEAIWNETKWPHELASSAYCGVAGDLVRLIEPHTESDSVALLSQTLVAFGNLIGRTAYFVAENDQHFCNNNLVLVGSTSKGRKGSSLGKVRRAFLGLDESWEARRPSGLASGEGLIWAVRDQIEKQEAIKDKGRITGYQTVIADEGVADKRLLVVEPEFAQVLKVAGRESNILSSVIRMAFDSGNLQSLAKNSPAKATGAHISIIGHITKTELLRQLSATECANGFANRFKWVCVRRSKLLPDGGALHIVNFSEIAARFRHAFEFAQSVGELRRDDEARQLWHSVYKQLSEGRPGLLGDVTSRAEVHVMRDAMVYALLDCSPQIRRAHLTAALALWRYCEQSAHWIFGTSTGNRNADKIFSALQQAGSSGMTRTEIQHQVFNRNISSDALSGGLQILHESGHARFTKKLTGGAPSERWFVAGGVTNLTK